MNSKEPYIDISVCIITCNHERYITQSIMSVLSQKGNYSIEILVGIDHSEDTTLERVTEIANRFPSVVKYFHHNPRLGCGSINFQVLLKNAKGKYVAYLDGDDYWRPNKLKQQIQILDENHHFPACYTDTLTQNKKGVLTGRFTNYSDNTVSIDDLLTRGNFLNFSSLVFRRKYITDILSLKPPFIDYQVNLSLSRNNQLAYIPSPLVVYRYQSQSSMRRQANTQVRERYWTALRSELSEHHSDDKVLVSLSVFLRSIFYHGIKTKNLKLPVNWFTVVTDQTTVNPLTLVIYTLYEILNYPIKAVIGYLLTRNRILYRV